VLVFFLFSTSLVFVPNVVELYLTEQHSAVSEISLQQFHLCMCGWILSTTTIDEMAHHTEKSRNREKGDL
jgi:hypothetical protein